MTDVIPDEIQPDGSGSSDPGPEATLEVSPSAAAAAEPAMPSVSEAAAGAAETATPAETSSAEASSIETAAAVPAASSTAALSSPAAPEAAAPEPAAQARGDSPSLEASTSVPPAGDTTAASGGEGGGEWELLLAKLQGWLGSGQLQELWSQARRPLNLVLAAVALLLVLRVYTGLIEAINGLPLVAGLLELVGLIWAVRCGLPRLLQSSAREQLLQDLQQRWRSFSGRG